MTKETTSQNCIHIKDDESKACPYLCQSWLNPFPWDKTNAKFDKTDILANFLKNVQSLSAGVLFDSIDLVYDKELNNLVENVRSSVDDVNSDKNWKQRLVDEVKKLDSLPTLNDKQFAVFQQVVDDKLLPNININKGKTIPSMLIMTPEEDEEKLNVKMVFNALKKKRKWLTTDDIVSMHETLPELKSITIKDLHFKMDKYDDIDVKENCLESLDFNFSNPVDYPSSLLAFLFRSYHETIKSLKLTMSIPALPEEAKKREDRASQIKKVFRENNLSFSNMEHLEINNFADWIDICTVLKKLETTSCHLKHVKFLGQETAKDIFKFLTRNQHCFSLESLSISTKKYEDIRLLSNLKALKELSYLWANIEEKVDILKALMILPNLTSLELGHEKRLGELVSNVVNFDTYSSLNRVSLSNVHIDRNVFEKLNSHLPNLKNVVLTKCRIGKDRSDSEAAISFGSYTLDTLVIEDCKLNYASKLSKNAKKGNITRFMLAMASVEPYVATIRSSVEDESKNGKLYIENRLFVYDVAASGNNSSAPVTLSIKANLIRSFSVSRNNPAHVALCLENEIEIESEDDFSDNSANETEDVEEVENLEEAGVNKTCINETQIVEEAEGIEEISVAEETEIVEEIEDLEEAEDVEEVSRTDEVLADKIEDRVVEETKETEVIEEINVIKIDVDNDEEVEEYTGQIEEETSDVGVDKASEVDEDFLPEVPRSPALTQEENVVGDLFYGSEADSVGEQDELIDSSSDMTMDEDTTNNTNRYDSDDDEPVVIIKVNSNSSAKINHVSDEDYASSEDVITSYSSESEFDDDMGTVRRSSRLIPRKPLTRFIKSRAETRKRQRELFSTSEEEETDKEDAFSDIISQFVLNCKKYDAVIRIPPRKRSKTDSYTS